MERKIEVTYDGAYPSACMGRLTIKKGGRVIYDEEFCCSSSGSVWFDDEWTEHVEEGELTWDDAEKFPEDVRDAVSKVLSGVGVCCGGCV